MEEDITYDLCSGDGLQSLHRAPEILKCRECEQYEREAEHPSQSSLVILALEGMVELLLTV